LTSFLTAAEAAADFEGGDATAAAGIMALVLEEDADADAANESDATLSSATFSFFCNSSIY